MKKIDIIIPNFDDFGAQRVAINVANGLQGRYQVRFVVFNDQGPFRNYLDQSIVVEKLDYGFWNIPKFRLLPRFWRYLRSAQKNGTEVAIAFSPVANLVILFAKFFHPQLKTIIQEHGFPSLAIKDRQNMGPFLEWVFRHIVFRLYNLSDIFICITEAIKQDFVANFGIKGELVRVVRNPVDIAKLEKLMAEPVDFRFLPDKKYLIGIGRLVDQKNFFKLVRIFSKVRQMVASAELLLLGAGPDREGLIKLSAELGLGNHVHLLGFQKNPYYFLGQADCYCLTSNWEGLPQVIAEAMICRTPVVANDCPSGPSEMIVDGQTGFLVPLADEESFAERVIELLRDQELNQRLSEAGYDFAVSEYSLERCVSNYQKILESL